MTGIFRTCKTCGAVHPLWHFNHLYVPRTPEEKGWLCRQCPKCFSEGGALGETDYIEAKIAEKKEAMGTLKEEIHELTSILRHINRKTIAIGDNSNEP